MTLIGTVKIQATAIAKITLGRQARPNRIAIKKLMIVVAREYFFEVQRSVPHVGQGNTMPIRSSGHTKIAEHLGHADPLQMP
jgi:hypothetical protein